MRTADGGKQHYILDRYCEEGERRWSMLGGSFTNFYRTLSTYVLAYRDAGFTIDEFIEPSPTTGNLLLFPELDDELRVPNFIDFVLSKPAKPPPHTP
jgi:hypothetical protein